MKILKRWIAHAFYDWLLSVKEPAVEYTCHILELGSSVIKILKKRFRCHDMVMHTTIKIVQEKLFLAAVPGNKRWTLKKQDKKTLTLLIFDVEHIWLPRKTNKWIMEVIWCCHSRQRWPDSNYLISDTLYKTLFSGEVSNVVRGKRKKKKWMFSIKVEGLNSSGDRCSLVSPEGRG